MMVRCEKHGVECPEELRCLQCAAGLPRATENKAIATSGTTGIVVVPIRKNGGPPENASSLVWMIGRLALKARYEDVCKPQVGDTVIEVTHLMGMARHKLGLLSAVGELLKVEQIEGEGEAYTIRTIEGVEQRWLNAKIYVVERRENIKAERQP